MFCHQKSVRNLEVPTQNYEHDMEEHDKLSKLLMWSKIKELISEGLNYSQISRQLDMHRQTVAHYASMSYEEFTASHSYQRDYAHKLDIYEDFVLRLLDKYPFVSAAQVHDRLREKYPDMKKVSEKTVFNFVKRLRLTHDIPKEGEDDARQMCKLPDTDFGEYVQVDFGEKWMSKLDGGRVKVYFMVMVLSRSRYKFVYFSKTPFTTATAIYAHELAFRYFGGKPKKLIYDQDRVFIKDENLGDYMLTARFRAFCSQEKLEVVFCRKSDPQSKGKVENAVKYVKNNFLSAREFTDIDTLNREGLAWLERTANGSEHRGIRRIPADLFEQEKEWLTPYTATPTLPREDLESRVVRKDNTFMYEGNFYTVPAGTYKNSQSIVYVERTGDTLNAYSVETGKTIATHTVCLQKGKTISNVNHRRQPSLSLQEYSQKVQGLLPNDESVVKWMQCMKTVKGRFYRDSLAVIEREQYKYSRDTLCEAFERCLKLEVFNANTLFEVARQLRNAKHEPEREKQSQMENLKECFSKEDITPDTSSINTYQDIFNEAI